MDGFEVIASVGADRMPPLIFVTAYDQYALDAFDVQAIDYLLKPFDEERLHRSFARANARIREKHDQSPAIQALLETLKMRAEHLQRIMVKQGSRFFYVDCDDVLYMSAEEKYVELHTAAKTHLIRDSIAGLEKRLDPAKFIRIHRSTLLHVGFLKEILPGSHGDCTVVLTNGQRLVLSRRYRDRVFPRN